MSRARLVSHGLGGSRRFGRPRHSAGAVVNKVCLTIAIACTGLPRSAATAQPLDPLAYTSLGTLNLSGGAYTIDADALVIYADAALAPASTAVPEAARSELPILAFFAAVGAIRRGRLAPNGPRGGFALADSAECVIASANLSPCRRIVKAAT